MATQRATLKHAVMGLVLERPAYGYELMNRLDQRFSYWRGTGVYDALDRLEGEKRVVGGDGRGAGSQRSAPKTVYRATDAGRQFFHEWLLGPTEFTPPRQDLDLKIGLSGPDEWPALIDQIVGQEAFCMSTLKKLTDLPAHLRPVSSQPDGPKLVRCFSATLKSNCSRSGSNGSRRYARRCVCSLSVGLRPSSSILE